ncbi:MAG: hypothetical protein CMG78_12175 [Marinobacter sp.]|nr:hypothetical protein [Marinobacter sp.]|tara:strand:- start:715 stop:1155 length:441 start_codon:yes stop_codon:yes gene_type:complete
MELQDISHITPEEEARKNPERTEITEDSLGSVGKAKLEALETSISEIEELIEERENLSEEVFKDGEKTKREISNFILANEKADNSLEKQDALIGLRQKQVDMTELQLNERVTCWKDVAVLKKELRDKEQEFTEKTERMKVISEILE